MNVFFPAEPMKTKLTKCMSHFSGNLFQGMYHWYSAPLTFQDLISNSPNCLPNYSHHVSLDNLVLDQSVIPLLIFFFILITCPHDIVSDIVRRDSVLVTHGS